MLMSSFRFTVRQLEHFVAAADAGSISTAAERGLVSQAGVSLAISDLERHLGVQLFLRRKAKGVPLTSAGERVLADARRLLAQAEELQTHAAAEGDGLTGRLGVGCYTTLAPYLLPPLL